VSFGLDMHSHERLLVTVVVVGTFHIHRVRKKKSLQYFMCNFNKFKDIFIIFGKNHPETTFY